MKKLRLTTSTPTAVSPSDRLCTALRCGVVDMLSGADVLRVLSTSSLVRSDADALCCALRTLASAETHRWRWLDTQRLAHTPAVAATAVQLAWRIQSFLHDHDLGGDWLRPFVVLHSTASNVPIPLQHPASSSAARTVFGSHWDSIHGDTALVECALCEASVTSVCQYRDDTDAFTSEFEAQLTQREAQWEAQGGSPSEVLEKGFAFQQAYFGHEPFFNAYVANQDDAAVLRYVCERGRFPLALSDGDTTGETLSAAARDTCRRAYRPVKRLLTTICTSPFVRSSETETGGDFVTGAYGELLVGFCVSSHYR